MHIKLIKFIDKTLGQVFIHLSPFSPKTKRFSLNSVLFIRPGGIGDAVLLIPAINLLKEKFPHMAVDVLAEKRNKEVFSASPAIDRIFAYDTATDLAIALRAHYDVVIDTEQWHRLSAIVARLTGAPTRIGFETNARKKIFTHPISYSQDMYEANSFFNLLAPFSVKGQFDPDRPFLKMASSLPESASSLLEPSSNGKLIALFPGGSIKERRWSPESFHAVAGKLINHGCYVVIVGGKDDVLASSKIAEGFRQAINLSGKLSLPETAAILKRSELLISGDSGILHLAYGLGVKTVSLFGPGREKKWAPKGLNHIVINMNLDCSPCTTFGYTSRCKKDAECMKKITVKEVFEAAMKLLKEGPYGIDRNQ